MRVLISAPSLTTSVNVSGVASVVEELVEALRVDVEHVHVLLGSPQNGAGIRRWGVALINTFRAALKVASTRAPVLHSNTALMSRSILRDLLIVVIAKLTGKRVLLHFHGGTFLETKATGIVGASLKALLNLADIVVFLSETERRLFEVNASLECVRARAIYNSVRIPPPELAQTERKGPLRVVFAGRLVPEKGIQVLLQAVAASNLGKVQYTVYGDGPLVPAVRNAATNNSCLCYRGVFAHDTWPHILRNYDVLVLPSTDPFEGMPMIILEAMALGLVTIATPFGSIPELIGKDERGILVPPGDVGRLSEVINRLAAEPKRLATMRAAAMDFAHTHLDVAATSRTFLSLYRDLSGARG